MLLLFQILLIVLKLPNYSINKQDILSNIKLKNKIIKILKDYKNKTESKSQYIKRVIFFLTNFQGQRRDN